MFPTLDGKIVAGPTAVDGEDKSDWSVRPEARADILPKAVAMLPALEGAEPVAEYAGLRPAGPRRELPDRALARLPGARERRGDPLDGHDRIPRIAEHVCRSSRPSASSSAPSAPLEPGEPPPARRTVVVAHRAPPLAGMTLLLGIDEGTSAVKAILFDEELRPLREARREKALAHPRPGWVEQDPEEMLDAVVEAVAELLDDAPGEVVACGLDHQGESVLAWDAESGKPLTPIVTWQDKRSQEVLDRLERDGHAER